jgi:hypothetical protein
MCKAPTWVIAIMTSICVVGAIKLCAADSPTTKPPRDEQSMETWWEDLEKQEPQASRALLKFAGKPEESVAFLKDHLPPLKLSAEDLQTLLTDLGSDDEAYWKPAFEKLQYLDPRLATGLPALMKDVTDQVTRNRLVEVLCDYSPDSLAGKTVTLRKFKKEEEYNFVESGSSWWAEAQIARLNIGGTTKRKWTRAARAIALLEHIATPGAVEVLTELATGHPDAEPTKQAQEAINSLGSAEK